MKHKLYGNFFFKTFVKFLHTIFNNPSPVLPENFKSMKIFTVSVVVSFLILFDSLSRNARFTIELTMCFR